MATDCGRVSSTANPSAVETGLDVFLKRRQEVFISFLTSRSLPSTRLGVARTHKGTHMKSEVKRTLSITVKSGF